MYSRTQHSDPLKPPRILMNPNWNTSLKAVCDIFVPEDCLGSYYSWWPSADVLLLLLFQGSVTFRQRLNLSCSMTKPIEWYVRPAKTQISLGIRPFWSESSFCAQWVAKDQTFLQADSEDSDQIGRMHRLIWVFAGRTGHFAGFVIRRLSLVLPSALSELYGWI